MEDFKMDDCGCITENGKVYQCKYHQNEMYVAFGLKKNNPIPKPEPLKDN